MLNWAYWPGLQGGAETQTRMLAKELLRQGESVIVVTRWNGLGYKFRENDDGVMIYRLGLGAIFYQLFSNVWKILKKLRPQQASALASRQEKDGAVGMASGAFEKRNLVESVFDLFMWIKNASFMLEALLFFWLRRNAILCVHSQGSGESGAVAAWIGRCTGLPVLIREVCLPVLWPLRSANMPFAQTLDRWQRDCFFSAQNEDQRAELVKKGVSADKISVVLDGVQLPPEVVPAEENATALIVANVAQGKAHKAFDVLFGAWRKVVDSKPDAKLVLIGGRADNTYWVKHVEQLGLRDQVEFQGWIENLDPFMKKAAMFLLPSRREGVSIALLTAQSYGLPAVVSDIPGNRFVVENGRNGIIAPVEDIDALADGILRLYNDIALRKEMGAVARQVVESRFSIHAVAERMINEVYPAVAASAASR
jgi:glycosyltransferase involved in cell wall biosynthesis